MKSIEMQTNQTNFIKITRKPENSQPNIKNFHKRKTDLYCGMGLML